MSEPFTVDPSGVRTPGPAERFAAEARGHADAGRQLDRVRALTSAVAALGVGSPVAAVIELGEVDAVLAARGEPAPAWRAQAVRLDLVAARVLLDAGLADEARERLDRVVATGVSVLPADETTGAGTEVARLHLDLDDPARAGLAARAVLRGRNGPLDAHDDCWSAAVVLALALRFGGGSHQEARTVMDAYGIGEDDLDAYDG